MRVPSSGDDWIPLNQGMQFMEAIFCGGTWESQKEARPAAQSQSPPRCISAAPEASCFDLVFHFVSLPWKLSLGCMGWRRKKGMIRHGYLFHREHDDNADAWFIDQPVDFTSAKQPNSHCVQPKPLGQWSKRRDMRTMNFSVGGRLPMMNVLRWNMITVCLGLVGDMLKPGASETTESEDNFGNSTAGRFRRRLSHSLAWKGLLS